MHLITDYVAGFITLGINCVKINVNVPISSGKVRNPRDGLLLLPILLMNYLGFQ